MFLDSLHPPLDIPIAFLNVRIVWSRMTFSPIITSNLRQIMYESFFVRYFGWQEGLGLVQPLWAGTFVKLMIITAISFLLVKICTFPADCCFRLWDWLTARVEVQNTQKRSERFTSWKRLKQCISSYESIFPPFAWHKETILGLKNCPSPGKSGTCIPTHPTKKILLNCKSALQY